MLIKVGLKLKLKKLNGYLTYPQRKTVSYLDKY